MKKLFSLFLFTGILLTIQPINAFFGDDTAEGAFFGGVTGAAIGGAAGGWKGAAIGGTAGTFLGAAAGSSHSNRHYPERRTERKLNRLYKKRDRLEHRIKKANNEKRRMRYQENLQQVNHDIRTYERQLGYK